MRSFFLLIEFNELILKTFNEDKRIFVNSLNFFCLRIYFSLFFTVVSIEIYYVFRARFLVHLCCQHRRDVSTSFQSWVLRKFGSSCLTYSQSFRELINGSVSFTIQLLTSFIHMKLFCAIKLI